MKRLPANKEAFCTANFIAIATIPVLFFIAMILGYIGYIPLNVPVHSLGVIGFILFIFLLFIKHNANCSICKMRASYMKLELAVQEELKRTNLCINDEIKSVANIGDFLNRYYANIRNDNFVSVASSIFPMLGILGTFIAIAISMPDFSVTDTAALDHEISALLSGVGSAFFASIYGILLSLIWTYFEKRGLSKIDVYFTKVQNDFEKSLWSKEELLVYKYTQYELKDNRFISALKETFNLDFLRELNREHEENFTTLSSHLQGLNDELTTLVAKVDTSTTALSAQQSINNSIDEFTQVTHSLEKTTKLVNTQLNSSLNRTFEKIDTEISGIVIKLADFATHVSLESRKVQDSMGKYHSMVAENTKK